MHPLKEIFEGKIAGQKGVFSVCTANPMVIRAALSHAKENNYITVIEATANQVNQFGGYTGMVPSDFMDMVQELRRETGLPEEQMILGGDHLGPLTWQHLKENEAMDNSEALVRAYTRAGFTKIHLDTSMRVADDDPDSPLSVEVCARRGARLALAVMEEYSLRLRKNADALRPVLVIGSEVPIPGGSQEFESSITPTSPEEFRRQYLIFKDTFLKAGAPFQDVVAFVVQPGVEFGDDFAFQYDSTRANSLCEALKEFSPLVFEGHSTDYQTAESLAGMVRDGIRILKVGPALTFGLREGLLLLEECERQMDLKGDNLSDLRNTILNTMDKDDHHWKKYYQGTPEEIRYKMLYSYSDRCRYYLPDPSVKEAIKRLLANTAHVPLALISQYFPRQYGKVVCGSIGDDGESLVLDRISDWISPYAAACGALTPGTGV